MSAAAVQGEIESERTSDAILQLLMRTVAYLPPPPFLAPPDSLSCDSVDMTEWIKPRIKVAFERDKGQREEREAGSAASSGPSVLSVASM